jgi:sodium/proline symporter
VLAPGLRRLGHRTGVLTVTELLAGPPGQPLRRAVRGLASVIVLGSLAAYVAAQFQGAGKTFAETFGLSLTAAIVVGAAVVLLYTMLGGFWAVSLTDVLQGLVMAASAVLLPAAALWAVGGPAELWHRLHEVTVSGYGSPVRGLPLAAGVAFVLGLMGIGLGYPGQPHVVNRFMAARDEASVRIGRRIAIAWAAVIYAGMILLGLCGRVLTPDLADPELVFVTAAHQLFHPLVGGVLIAAVLSAIMSTVDSQLLVAASAVTHDLGLGGTSQGSLVVRSRLVVLLLGAGAVGLALVGTPQIFQRVLFAWSAMGSAFGPLLLVTVLRGPVRPWPTLAAMALGGGLSVLAYWFPETRGGFLERVVPFCVALAVAVAGSTRSARNAK